MSDALDRKRKQARSLGRRRAGVSSEAEILAELVDVYADLELVAAGLDSWRAGELALRQGTLHAKGAGPEADPLARVSV